MKIQNNFQSDLFTAIFNFFLIDFYKIIAILLGNSYFGYCSMTLIPVSLLIALFLMAMMMAMVMRGRTQQAALARRRLE